MLESILIVEDTDFVRFGLRELIHRESLIRVAEAGNAREALDLGRALRPDTVLVDTSRDPGSGLALLRKMTALLPGARLVAVLSEGDHESALEAGRLGVEFTLHKPYDPRTVRSLLRRLDRTPALTPA